MPNQPREYFDLDALERLKESIREIGQQTPAHVVLWNDGKLRLRDGERRWRCCQELNRPLYVLVVERASDEIREFELATVANLNRAEHTAFEKARAMLRLQENGRTYEQIARVFGVSVATVNNYLKLFRDLDPRVLNLMDPNQMEKGHLLTPTVALELTPFKKYPDRQFGLARRIVTHKLTLSLARNLIAREAVSLGITKGRGIEKGPVDHRRNLQRALSMLRPRVGKFLQMDQAAIDELFARVPAEEHQRVLGLSESCLKELEALHELLKGVRSPGCKRSFR